MNLKKSLINKLFIYLFIYLFILLLFFSCSFKNCNDIQKADMLGYYISLNDENENKEFLELRNNGIYYHKYCKNDTLIEEINTWDYTIGCRFTVNNLFFLHECTEDFRYLSPNFKYENGKLDLGEDYCSFKKVCLKPKLECE